MPPMSKNSPISLKVSLTKFMTFKRPRYVITAPLYLFHKCLRRPPLPQTTELSTRIKIAEKQVKKLVSEEFVTTPSPTQRHDAGSSVPDREDPEASRKRDTLHQDGGSDDDDDDDDDDEGTTLTEDTAQSLDALEEQFHLLEEEVANLVADVHDLALYTKLNITGFMKILKVRHFMISVRPLSITIANR
jgi:hypothetical protein